MAGIGVAIALLLGIAVGGAQVAVDFFDQEKELTATVQRILQVAKRAATPAALNLDEKLATEIVSGLLDYEFIVAASIITDLGDSLASTKITRPNNDTRWITRKITAEFSEHSISLRNSGDAPIDYGTLAVVVDHDAALAGFFGRALFLMASEIARSSLLVLLLFGIFYWRLSKPLATLVDGLARIDPDNLGATRLSSPQGHTSDELGVLARTVNRFLETSQTRLAEREHAENLLRESEQRLRAVLDNTPVCMNLKDTEGRYLLINKPYEEWLGRRAEEILGKTSADTIDDDAELSNLTISEQHVLQTGRSFEKEVSAFRNGELHHRILIKYPVNSTDGSISAIGTVAVDITERKNAEQSLRKYAIIWEQVSEAILVLNAEGEIIDWNPGAERTFGYSKEEMIGKYADVFLKEEEPGARRRAVNEAIKKDGFYIGQTTFVRKDGREGVIEAQIMPLFDDNGEIVGRVGVNRDITERLQTEERLRQAQKMEAVGQLTGGIAHDFNNLLQIVQSHLEAVKWDTQASENTLAHVESALKAGYRGANLTQQLLAFSRKQTLHPQITAPNESIEGMLNLLGRTLGEHIEIDTVLEKDIPSIKIDPNGFENTILNLAVNARTAMKDGGKLLVTSAVRDIDTGIVTEDGVLPAGKYVEITMTDTGDGMAPDVLAHAFEPFFTTKDVGEGSGLGLSMVYGFLRQSGGHVSLQSEPGNGTAARLLIPAADEVVANPPETSKQSIAPRNMNSGTILVVEDDPDVRRSAVMVLNAYGFDAREASDATAALEILARDTDIDILFSDVVMPKGMNGLELAREAARLHSGLKILLTSGYPDAELEKSGVTDSGFELIGKPYTNEQLSDALTTLLGDD